MDTIVYDGIEIKGTKTFITYTTKALDLIKKAKGDYDYFAFVRKNVGIIQEHSQSGMVVYNTPPMFQVGKPTYTASVSWYASCIVHDANHSYQYRLNKPYHGKESENECLKVQIEFLRRINGPKHEISHLENLLKNEVDYYSSNIKRTW